MLAVKMNDHKEILMFLLYHTDKNLKVVLRLPMTFR